VVLKISTATRTAIGKTIEFDLYDDCSRFDLLHLMWKDAKGSWISFPFKYVHTDSTEVTRSEYYRNSWNWDNNSFGYEDSAKGDSTFFTRSRDKMSLTSGWLNEYDNVLIKDLMQSASVYLQDKDGIILACTIQDSEIAFGSKQNDDIWSYKLAIKMANDEIRL